jgi:hypothetical protein
VISLMPTTETGTCETHAGLLEDFEVARDEWNARRTEISNSGLRGKRIDDELRCLQARFARSYALVLNHLRDCSSCEPSRGVDHDVSDAGDGRYVPEFRVSLFSNARYSRVQNHV